MSDEEDFGGRGDELGAYPPPYPEIGTFEWRRRMQLATTSLHYTQVECDLHFAKIHEHLDNIMRMKP